MIGCQQAKIEGASGAHAQRNAADDQHTNPTPSGNPMTRYDHAWPALPFIGSVSPDIARQDLVVPGHRVWKLRGLLGSEECEQIIRTAEGIGFQDARWEHGPSNRDCERVVALSPDLAKTLWVRLLPHLTIKDLQGVRPYGFGNHGTWKPASINPCCRITRYSPGHHSNPHRDGAFGMTDNYRSAYTLQVYLNDTSAFKGGHTNFMLPHPTQDALAGDVCASVVPEVGMGLIFNHDVHHEGAAVTEGVKYILRTDVMFHRIDGNVKQPTNAYLKEEAYHEAERLHAEAIRLQGAGDTSGSTAAYLAALQLQAQLLSIPANRLTSSSTAVIDKLPEILHTHMLSFLPLREIVRSGLVSSRWCELMAAGQMWAGLYARRWRRDAANPRITSALRILPTSGGCASASPSLGAELVDWYTLYRNRHYVETRFEVVVMDIGHAMAHMVFGGQKLPQCLSSVERDYYYYRYSDVDHEARCMLADLAYHTSRSARVHFWAAESGFGRCVLYNELIYTCECALLNSGTPLKDIRWAYKYKGNNLDCIDPLAFQEILRLVMAGGLKMINGASPGAHPIMLVVPPFLSSEQRELLESILFETGFPYVKLVDAPVVALGAQGLDSGIDVNAGPDWVGVSGVANGRLEPGAFELLTTAGTRTFDEVPALVQRIADKLRATSDPPSSPADPLDVVVHGAKAESCAEFLESALQQLDAGTFRVRICPPSWTPFPDESDEDSETESAETDPQPPALLDNPESTHRDSESAASQVQSAPRRLRGDVSKRWPFNNSPCDWEPLKGAQALAYVLGRDEYKCRDPNMPFAREDSQDFDDSYYYGDNDVLDYDFGISHGHRQRQRRRRQRRR